jgi:hypothetical protein
MRNSIAILGVTLALVTTAGCCLFDTIIANGDYGEEFEIDGDSIGTGRQSIHQTDDERVWRGEISRHPDDDNVYSHWSLPATSQR